MRSLIFLFFCYRLTNAFKSNYIDDDDQCNERSCYPATGNLLIGRKLRLSATSTCGIRGRQRYCIVSHLEEQTKCFYCDSRTEWKPHRDPHRLSHRIDNVVTESYEDRYRNWWQSENGVQNVSVQLDLEAEFHFTHLIMTFKSFRPAAMIIERSADFGKTWSPYRYFAYDCVNTFPNITGGPPMEHTDVICTGKYSDVAPSTGGELVYKVISPHIPTENPYADEIANLLKITNLRINFTKLHTLGDDLLDYRPEIHEKYYYAIYEMVVRGSCSCYGHAQRCIPINENLQEPFPYRGDMVHGRCECTHNTKGLNCEQCMDFYNEMPWRPALGDDSNECKRCECNGHASRCHFDRGVYQASGFVSGGICDDCMHNTQGKNCEQCKPFYYRNSARPSNDPYTCLPCECDKAGSLNAGICEGEDDAEKALVAGKCYCKANVDGARCDHCKNGFWDLKADNAGGCKACECYLLGTFNNEGCNKYTGECFCKRLVAGPNCDKCLRGHYGLSEDVDGCKSCNCDIGGSFDDDCDAISGQCKCRENFGSRRCETAKDSYFCPNIDHYLYEAEFASTSNAEVLPQVGAHTDRTWTGDGFVRVGENSLLTFKVDNLAQSMYYGIVIRYKEPEQHVGWENVQVTVVRPTDPSPDGDCANAIPSDDFLIARLFSGGRYTEVQPSVCLEAGSYYEIRVQFGERRTGSADRSAAVLIDSIVLVPPVDALHIYKGSPEAEQAGLEFERYQCRHQALSLISQSVISEVCQRYLCPVAAAMFNRCLECECDPTGSISGICEAKGGQCECKPNVVGRRCDQCAAGTYGFGPSGCKSCDCDSVGSLNNNCDRQSGQCLCSERRITGRQCNQCQPGFWSFPDCRVCQCNDHASICDQKTGACIECRDLTDGYYCERCKDGYYGDPRLGINLPCKPCPCPGGLESGFQHADTCYLQPGTEDISMNVICNCRAGYTGDRCSICALNHWGNPNELGGTCEHCDCNGNIDITVEGSCDAETGECIKCLYHTQGMQCENCIEGYFGDAKIRSCQRCVCNELGTNITEGACSRITGQCPCLPNVVGQQCEACEEHHFNLASGYGCEPCKCDPSGVLERTDNSPELQCNEIDGRCPCKLGRGGRKCSDCQDYYWGDPKTGECNQCQCNPTGSATLQCHRSNGTCICLPGSGGSLCNECARGYTGTWPRCEPCGECFHNWDAVIHDIKRRINGLIERADNIEDSGITSAFDDAFERMEKMLLDMREQLESSNITKSDIESVQLDMERLLSEVNAKRERLNEVGSKMTEVSIVVDSAGEDLKSLLLGAEELVNKANALNENATLLREADVQGAYNITKESAERSSDAKIRIDKAVTRIALAESDRREAEALLENNQMDFEKQFDENEMALNIIGNQLSTFESYLTSLNKDVCGAEEAPCDKLCGGPGDCGHCGGRSCLDGSVSKAEQALIFANEANQKLNEKQGEAEEILKRVRSIMLETSAAKSKAIEGHHVSEAIAKQAKQIKNASEEIIKEMNEFLEQERSSPAEIRTLAEEIANLTISLTPNQIEVLANQIRDSLTEISDIDTILEETRGNKSIAAALQKSAEEASRRAAEIRNTTTAIRDALKRIEEAQNAAQSAINDAKEQIANARTDLHSSDDEASHTEESLSTSNESLSKLEDDMKNVRVQYLQISEFARSAYEAADKAIQHAAVAESTVENLEKDIKSAKELLSKRQTDDVGSRTRAEELKLRATQLLHTTQRHHDGIAQLTADMDASDVRLGEYDRAVTELGSRIDRVTEEIRKQIDYYSTCDI